MKHLGSKRTHFCYAVLLLLVGVARAADCDYLPEEPRPSWTGGAPAASDDFLANGQARVERGGYSVAVAEARQQALRNLAETIQVRVTSSTTVSQSKTAEGKRWLTANDVQSVSNAATDVVLRDVRSDTLWLDRKSCTVWILARVSQARVALIQREEYARAGVGELKNRLAIIDDQARPLAERRDALEFSAAIVDDVEFDLLRNEAGRLYYRDALAERRAKLETEGREVTAAKRSLQQVDSLLASARSAGSAAEKSAFYRQALASIETVRRQFPAGSRDVASRAELAVRSGDIEFERNNACGAKRHWSSLDVAARAALAADVRNRFESLQCGAADLRRETWRAAFEGTNVRIVCAQNLGGAWQEWSKGCEVVAADLRAIGANAVVSPAARSIAPLAGWINGTGELLAPPGGRENMLVVAAIGKVGSRTTEAGGSSGVEYQFSGTLASAYLRPGTVAATDRYSVSTGWNGISEQMTMELLAIGAYRRFREKLENYLSADAGVR